MQTTLVQGTVEYARELKSSLPRRGGFVRINEVPRPEAHL